jgi:hypothetical protein
MSVKLPDAQVAMLSAAAQREDLCLTAPDKMKGAVLSKVSAKLMKLGLVRVVRAQAGMPVWRQDDVGQRSALKLTAAALKAIAIDALSGLVFAAFQRHFRSERVDDEADASTVATLKALIEGLECE